MKILLFLLELSAIFLILKNILHVKVNLSFLRLSISAFLVLAWTLYLCLYTLTFPNTLIIFIIIFLAFKEKWYLTLCWICIYSLIINVISSVMTYLYCMIASIEIGNNTVSYVYSDMIVFTCMILLSILMRHKTPEHISLLKEIGAKDYCLIIFVCVIDFFLSSVASLLFVNELNALGKGLLMFAIILMIPITILLLLLYFRQQHYHLLLQQTNSINQRMLQLEEQHYRDLQKKNMDLRAFRHDYNYHITAMQGLAAENDLTHLKKYVENLFNVREQVYYFNTNHTVADAIVNYFYENLPEETLFQMDGKFPENIFVDDSDLCVVLSNLLKNAVEAVSRLNTSSERKINLILYTNAEYLSIMIENSSLPYQKEGLTQLSTSKADAHNHGFGLKNVRNTVEKYHGKLDLHYKDGIFTACAILRNIS